MRVQRWNLLAVLLMLPLLILVVTIRWTSESTAPNQAVLMKMKISDIMIETRDTSIFHLKTASDEADGSETDSSENKSMHDDSTLQYEEFTTRRITTTSQFNESVLYEPVEAQKQRLQVMIETCEKFDELERTKDPDWNGLHYDDTRRYIYCRVPKASNTNWKRTLHMLTGKLNKAWYRQPEQIHINFIQNYDYSDKFIPRLALLASNESEPRINTYFKFLFIREPFERLVSSYRDKMIVDKSHYYGVQLRNNITRRYRPQLSTTLSVTVITANLTEPPSPTFAEFVRYVLEERAKGEQLDKHWLPQNELCRPCRIKYDFVGHQETLQADAEAVLTRLKAAVDPGSALAADTADVTFPAGTGDHGDGRSAEFVQKYITELPREYIRKLNQLYAVDLAMFGFKPWLVPAGV